MGQEDRMPIGGSTNAYDRWAVKADSYNVAAATINQSKRSYIH